MAPLSDDASTARDSKLSGLAKLNNRLTKAAYTRNVTFPPDKQPTKTKICGKDTTNNSYTLNKIYFKERIPSPTEIRLPVQIAFPFLFFFPLRY